MNEFQSSTVEELKRIYPDARTELFDLEADQPFAVVRTANLEFWVYVDGAGILGTGIDRRFEIYDFSSLSELRSVFLAAACSLAL